jgi:hypothetical protein
MEERKEYFKIRQVSQTFAFPLSRKNLGLGANAAPLFAPACPET